MTKEEEIVLLKEQLEALVSRLESEKCDPILLAFCRAAVSSLRGAQSVVCPPKHWAAQIIQEEEH